jgi:hypothetical protein
MTSQTVVNKNAHIMERGLANNWGRIWWYLLYILPLVISSQGQKLHKQSGCLITAPCLRVEEIMVIEFSFTSLLS